MLTLPDAGSLGGIVFTGTSYWGAGRYFHYNWAERLYDPDFHSLGEAIDIPISNGFHENQKRITNLWADPSLQLKYDMTVGVDEPNPNITVNNFSLEQNYPNPFNPSTKISFTIPASPLPFGKGTGVRLVVYDVLGNEIATLVNEEKSAGTYEVEFIPKNLTSGIYFYQLKAGSLVQTKKMILLK